MAEMSLRFMKTYREIRTNDPEIIVSVGGATTDVSMFGRKGIEFASGAAGYNGLTTVRGPAVPTLLASGATQAYFGFLSDCIICSVQSTHLLSFNTRSGSATVGGVPFGVGAHWVEIRIVRATTPALGYSYVVRLDGAQVANGVFDTAQGNALWSSSNPEMSFGQPWNGWPATRMVDLVMWSDVDNGDAFKSWMGPMQVDLHPAAGNGSKSEWLGSDGDSVNNYNLVNQVPMDTSKYVESSTNGQRDLYTVASPAVGLTPLGVRTKIMANKEGAGLRGLKPVLQQNNGVDPAVEIVSPEIALGLAATQYTTAPVGKSLLTNLPWTAAEIAQLQVGVESSTPSA